MSKIGDRIRRQNLLPTDTLPTDTKPQFLPSQQLAGRIARLQATPGARSHGLDFQRAFQGGLSDHDLRRVGLQRLEEKSPGLLKRLGGGALGGAIRILDTPSQMSLRFLTALRGGSYENPIEALGGAFKGTGQRRDFFDATGIERRGGITGGLINFLGTVATDPLTGLTFGATGAARTAIKEIAKEFGQETAEHVARHGLKVTKGMTESRLKDIKKLPSLQGKNLKKVEKGYSGRC